MIIPTEYCLKGPLFEYLLYSFLFYDSKASHYLE